MVHAEEGMLTIGDGGVYQHDRDGGKIPLATWAEGSTLHLTGLETQAPADRNQPYYNIIFETPNLLSNLNMNLDEVTIGGDIRVLDTGSARWYLTTTAAYDTSEVTIMGDVYVEKGAFSVQGTSNAYTTFIVHHYGNIVVTGGNFSISRGSQPGGTTTWYLYEGDFSMENATTQSSTATPGGAKFVFAKQGAQRLTLGEGNDIRALPIEVAEGTTLEMGQSRLAGEGIFYLHAGATLGTALPGGVAAIFENVTGQVTLEDESSYAFNGTEHQETSTRMPTVVRDLIIDNPAGVTLSQETTINGVLRLKAGVFDNTIPFTLGPNGRFPTREVACCTRWPTSRSMMCRSSLCSSRTIRIRSIEPLRSGSASPPAATCRSSSTIFWAGSHDRVGRASGGGLPRGDARRRPIESGPLLVSAAVRRACDYPAADADQINHGGRHESDDHKDRRRPAGPLLADPGFCAAGRRLSLGRRRQLERSGHLGGVRRKRLGSGHRRTDGHRAYHGDAYRHGRRADYDLRIP
ncbi:hypothetical protein [Rhodothermus marinus]|uniref:hypothetical protein n=1 Tax=Rhodothermus marinus TaxID=29549 RepID=UPI001FB4B27D|nr:hypothetical protein [Rhodothermus marinus]